MEEDKTTEQPSDEETLDYISDMLLSLEEMARRSKLMTLADLIDDAREEARRRSRKTR